MKTPAGIGPYRIERELGRGGMGVVYLARHEQLERAVAIKLLLGARETDANGLARFRREAEAVGRLRHAGIVAVHDLDLHAARPYLVMDFVEGEALDDRLERGGCLEPKEAARVAAEMASAVAYAHSQGVLHRDLKPGNVLLSGERVFVTDFGLAKDLSEEKERLTRTGQMIGTPAYMPPEQAEGSAAIDARADVYALGATLYAMLTGRPPFEGASAINIINAVLTHEAAPPSAANPRVPYALDAIVLRCLAKAPARRYPTAQALADDLRAFLEDRWEGAPPAGRSRWPLLLLAGGAVLLGALGLGGVFVFGSAGDPQPRQAPVVTPEPKEPIYSEEQLQLARAKLERVAGRAEPERRRDQVREWLKTYGRAPLEAGGARAEEILRAACRDAPAWEIDLVKDPAQSVWAVGVAFQGRRLISGLGYKSGSIVSARDLEDPPLPLWELPSFSVALAVHPTRNEVVVAQTSGVRVLESLDSNPVYEDKRGEWGEPVRLAFVADGTRLVVATISNIHFVSFPDLRILETLAIPSKDLRDVSLSPKGDRLAAIGGMSLDKDMASAGGGWLCLWELPRSLVRREALPVQGSKVSWDPKGSFLLAGDEAGAVWQLPLEAGAPRPLLDPQEQSALAGFMTRGAHGSFVSGIHISKEGRWAFTVNNPPPGSKSWLYVWDLQTLRPARPRIPRPMASLSLAASADDEFLAIGREDGKVEVWRIDALVAGTGR